MTGLIRCADGPALQIEVAWAVNMAEGTLRDSVVLLGDKGACLVDLWKNELIVSHEQDGRNPESLFVDRTRERHRSWPRAPDVGVVGAVGEVEEWPAMYWSIWSLAVVPSRLSKSLEAEASKVIVSDGSPE